MPNGCFLTTKKEFAATDENENPIIATELQQGETIPRGGKKHATDMVDHKRYLDCIAIEKRLRTESGDVAPVRESLCIQCYFHFDLGVKRQDLMRC